MKIINKDAISFELYYIQKLGYNINSMTDDQLYLALIVVWFYMACGGFSSDVSYRINQIINDKAMLQ